MCVTRKITLVCLTSLVVAVSGCTLADSPGPSPVPITATPVITIAATAITQTLPAPTLPALRTDSGPFEDAAWLLDGVCFEVLARMNGQSWSWGTPDALNAFFDRVDDAGLCGNPVKRQTFDFTDQILVGAVQTAQGCDAAHRLIDVVQDDVTHTRTLLLALDVRPGCPYELVQLFLVAVPRLPDTYTTQIKLESP